MNNGDWNLLRLFKHKKCIQNEFLLPISTNSKEITDWSNISSIEDAKLEVFPDIVRDLA